MTREPQRHDGAIVVCACRDRVVYEGEACPRPGCHLMRALELEKPEGER
jgi:hypothetical protein